MIGYFINQMLLLYWELLQVLTSYGELNKKNMTSAKDG